MQQLDVCYDGLMEEAAKVEQELVELLKKLSQGIKSNHKTRSAVAGGEKISKQKSIQESSRKM